MSPVEQASLSATRRSAAGRLLPAVAKIDPLPIAGVQARAARADAIAIIQKRRPGVRLALIAFLWLALGIAAGLLIR